MSTNISSVLLRFEPPRILIERTMISPIEITLTLIALRHSSDSLLLSRTNFACVPECNSLKADSFELRLLESLIL